MSNPAVEPETARDYEIDDLVQEVLEAEGRKIEAEEDWRKARDRLTAAVMTRGEQSSYGYTAENEAIRVTVVAPETTKIDEPALVARIGKRAFNALTVRKLDKTKVEQAVVDGTLSIDDLAAVTEVRATNPYPRLTRVDA